jgi:hypothetical protein
MDKLKDRMYDFEVTPPAGVWESIAAELDRGGAIVVPIEKQKKSNKPLYAVLSVAACVAALVFGGIWFMSSKKTEAPLSSAPINKTQDVATKEKENNDEKITAPKKTAPVTAEKGKPNEVLVKNTPLKKEPSKTLNNTAPAKNDDVAVGEPANSYITVAGPDGQPVKVSSKVASLIESSDNSYPPKPVWNKKINKWKDIMKANTLTPTTGNFLDIVDLTNSLKDDNSSGK